MNATPQPDELTDFRAEVEAHRKKYGAGSFVLPPEKYVEHYHEVEHHGGKGSRVLDGARNVMHLERLLRDTHMPFEEAVAKSGVTEAPGPTFVKDLTEHVGHALDECPSAQE